jgi:tetratricopeptide (TPR) repeat protein
MQKSTPLAPKVFISYAHEASNPEYLAQVLALADRLREGGVDAQIDQYERFPNIGWARWMDHMIHTSDFVVIICTPTYHTRATGIELPGVGRGVIWEMDLIYHLLCNTDEYTQKIIPIILDPRMQTFIPPRLRKLQYYILNEQYLEFYDRITQHTRALTPVLAPLAPVSPKERLPDFLSSLWNVPFTKHPCFIGRDHLLDKIRHRLNDRKESHQIEVLNGLGGMGKTQVAVEYAYRFRENYSAVLWVDASSISAIEASFGEITKQMDVVHADIVHTVKEWLKRTFDWLLIIDNADDISLLIHNNDDTCHPLADILSSPKNGHVLITSRAQDFQALEVTEPLNVDQWDNQQALDFLLTRTNRTQDSEDAKMAAIDLVVELGCFPLALEQAAAYILKYETPFPIYLDGYRALRLKMLERRKPALSDYPDSVATTWSVNFKSLEGSEVSINLLQLSAFIYPDGIPLDFIRLGASHFGEILSQELIKTSEHPFLLNEYLEPLAQRSLITHNAGNKTYRIHRMVQEVIRSELSLSEQRMWGERVARAIYSVLPNPDDIGKWKVYSQFAPIAEHCLELIEFMPMTADVGTILTSLGFYLTEHGAYASAELAFKKARDIILVSQDWTRADEARFEHHLAWLHYQRGEYAEAEPLFQSSLAVREQVYGDHHELARSLNDYALLLMKTGRNSDAEPMLLRSLEIRKRVCGAAEIASCLNNLAIAYMKQGKTAEAIEEYKLALIHLRDAYGDTHSSVGYCLNNLSQAQFEQNLISSAVAYDMFNKALSIFKASLGEDHPAVAMCKNNQAIVCSQQKNWSKTEQLFRDALEIRKKSLKLLHIDTIESQINLADFLIDQVKRKDSQSGGILDMSRLTEAYTLLDDARNALQKASVSSEYLLDYIKGLQGWIAQKNNINSISE